MFLYTTPERRQSKTLILLPNVNKKIVRNRPGRVFDCILLPDWTVAETCVTKSREKAENTSLTVHVRFVKATKWASVYSSRQSAQICHVVMTPTHRVVQIHLYFNREFFLRKHVIWLINKTLVLFYFWNNNGVMSACRLDNFNVFLSSADYFQSYFVWIISGIGPTFIFSVEQFGFRTCPMFCRFKSVSKLFAKVKSRRQMF